MGSGRLSQVLARIFGVRHADTPGAVALGRTDNAIQAAGHLGEDFFGGWVAADRALFEKHARPSAGSPGFITDFMGIRIRTAFHPWFVHLDGQAAADIPIPDDGLRAEAIEYFAMFDSLARAPVDRFAMAEVGASYGPWACVGGVLARRSGRKSVSLTAVEASPFLADLILTHLADNAITPANTQINVIQAAAATDRCTLQFPKVANASENGCRATLEPGATDYVGRAVTYEPVNGLPLSEILQPGITDLLHVDIQGAEAEVLAASMALLNERVRCLFIGTHSRKIEGALFELFHQAGWELLRERPTKLAYHAERPDIVGWTTRDGGQYWLNPSVDRA